MADEQNTGGNNQQTTPPATDGQNQQPGAGGMPTFDAWLATQGDDVKGLLDTHTKGLKSALDSERQQRTDLAKQLRDAAGKADKGSELEKALNEATGKLEMAERRATFVEEAIKPEIGCRNPKAAFLLAQADNLFDRRGNPDWQAIKAAAPELFGAPSVQGNAGAGTGTKPPTGKSMDDFIRAAARH